MKNDKFWIQWETLSQRSKVECNKARHMTYASGLQVHTHALEKGKVKGREEKKKKKRKQAGYIAE